MERSEKLMIGMTVIASVFTALILGSPDTAACMSLFFVIAGLVIIGVQTGSASSSNSAYASTNTAMISETIVKMDSRNRWRPKVPEEYEIGYLLILTGIILFGIMALITIAMG